MNTLRLFAGLLLLSLISTINISAKEIVINGKITTFDKYPLKNVSVLIKGTQKEVVSDIDGTFRIVCDEKDKLMVRANGFVPKSISPREMGSETPIQVNLKLKSGEKNYELATVFGHIKAETLSHAINLVEPNLNYGSYSKITDILTEKDNRISASSFGVKISGMSGKTLYVVDGSEVQYSYFESIPTTDIESIAVLKHTASARYGLKADGAVIEVVTKSN
ncbi:carboxypeptidase-like regulatory domain-containing protein [Prolixibacteraceae bacterium Z1-6]|uniref:Carboxypeptidase-like regulatory domain-containing protein n=1 Tax=Draconibacterium aestuarii TaxID=2998507 RepID=A0A9X3FA65_9BACT|nr:carboxypeptidase-like regulatory domain-containing protein [Prolixibacteraceae bacterium Z1-6]